VINKPWLDKVGMQIPQTTEEFEKVMRAFKENDMNGNGDKNDEIPYSSSSKGLVGYTEFFGAFGVAQAHVDRKGDEPEWIKVEDEKVVYTAITEDFRKCLNWLHSLYEEGLVDLEMLSQDHNQYKAKGN
jgi:putative aldouronate transport system substrate-binding protein